MSGPDQLYAEIVEVDGRKFLFWLEPEGDELKLHQITPVRGVGIADISITLTPKDGVSEADLWALFAQDNFAQRRDYILKTIEPLEEITP